MIAGAAACVWAALYVGAVGTAVTRGVRRRARAIPSCDAAVLQRETVLLRPCSGDEPGLVDRLSISGGAGRVLLAIGSLADDAAPAALDAAEALRQRGVKADVAMTGAVGPNHKADQLARALKQLHRRPRIVVVADSDVVLGDDDVRRLVGELEASGAAALWAPPVTRAHARTLAAAVLHGSMHAFPLLAGVDDEGFVGKLFAIRTDALEAAGGFEVLTDHLGEDMELGRRLRARGFETAPATLLATAAARATATRALLDRLTRWIVVIRAQRPHLLASYPLMIAAAPLAIVIAVLGHLTGDPWMFHAAMTVLAARSLVALLGPALVGRELSVLAPLLALFADSMLLVAVFRALATRTIVWRGRRLHVGERGRLEADLVASRVVEDEREQAPQRAAR